MAHTGVYATLAQYQAKCGANVAAATAVEAWANQVINEAESLINTVSRHVYAVDAAAFAALPAGTRLILTEVTTSLAAVSAIIYDMSPFTSRVEAEDMINVLRDAALRGLAVLRDQKAVTFVQSGT